MRRGQIWWATLPVPVGSEPGFRRPVLIVQADEFNESTIHTVVCAAITSNLQLAAAPGNVRLARRSSALSKESVVNVSQLVTLDKRFLVKCAGQLAPAAIREVEAGMRLVLAL